MLEAEAKKYGLRPNRGKCEHIQMNTGGRIKFIDSKHVMVVTEARYLGVLLHHKADPKVEIADRIKQAMATWKRLNKFLVNTKLVIISLVH